MANPSFQKLRIANMFRCTRGSPFQLQHRQYHSINNLVRRSPPCSLLRLSRLSLPRPSLTKSSHNPPLTNITRRRTYTTTTLYGERPAAKLLPGALIATCISVFAYSQYAQQQLASAKNPRPASLLQENFVLSVENIRAGRYWTLLTHTITHVTPIHLLVNMVALWSFGQSSIILFGPGTFIALWLGAGVVGGAVPIAYQIYQEQQRPRSASSDFRTWRPRVSSDPRDQRVLYSGAVGASAAVLGLIAAQTCFAPRHGIMIFPIPFALPSFVAVGAFAAFSAAAMEYGWLPGWGHLAHLSGMGVGGLMYLVVLRRRYSIFRGPGRWR